MRVIFQYVFSRFFYKYKISKIDSLGFIGILICMLNNNCFTNFSFVLMITSCYGIYFILQLQIDNSLEQKFLISLYVILFNLPIISLINNYISLTTIINSFVFSFVFSFIYIYFLIFMWVPIFIFVHEKLFLIANYLISAFSKINYLLFLPKFNDWQIIVYLTIVIIFSKIICAKIRGKYNDW